MGSGCFSPAPREGQIDIKVLEKIYENVMQYVEIDFESNSSLQNAKRYQLLKQELIKKGNVRRLCDYLSVHRFRICDNLLHNYRIIAQSKDVRALYAVIIILQEFFRQVPQSYQSVRLNPSSATRLNYSHNNSSSYIEISYSNLSKKIITESSSRVIPLQDMDIASEITSFKFESIYLNIIDYCLRDKGLYLKAIENLFAYCSFSIHPFQSSEAAAQIIKQIEKKIQAQQNLLLNLRCYQMLLGRTKSSDKSNIHILKDLIVFQVGQRDQQASPEKSEISIICRNILSRYSTTFSRFREIFLAFMDLMHKNRFTDIERIEDLLFEIINDNDLKKSFGREFILHFLSYVSFPCDPFLSKIWATLYPSENIQQLYPGDLIRQTKKNALPNVQKWTIYYSIADTHDLLQLNGQQLASAYIFNLYSRKQQLRNFTVECLINFSNRLNKCEKIDFLHHLWFFIQDNGLQDQIPKVICVIMRIIRTEGQINIPQNKKSMFLALSQIFDMQTNIKICQYMILILGIIQEDNIRTHTDQICHFLLSVLQAISSENSSKQKILLINQYIKVFDTNKANKYRGILFAFLQIICMKQNAQSQKKNILYIDMMAEKTRQFLGLVKINKNAEKYYHKIQGKKIELVESQIQSKYLLTRQQALSDYTSDQYKDQLYLKAWVYLVNFQNEEKDVVMSGFAGMHSVISKQGFMDQDDKELQNVIGIIKN